MNKSFKKKTTKVQVGEVIETPQVRCLDCPFKAGLKDDDTYCPTCEGTGQVEKEGGE